MATEDGSVVHAFELLQHHLTHTRAHIADVDIKQHRTFPNIIEMR